MQNKWKKYGLQKIMMNANGFFFKFDNNKGILDVLEEGPWLFLNQPIFLNIWSPTSTIKNDDIKKIAVWVTLHDVPLVAYTNDGLSMLVSKIGSLKLLDTYTSSMCSEAWGRSSYAWALVEIQLIMHLKRFQLWLFELWIGANMFMRLWLWSMSVNHRGVLIVLCLGMGLMLALNMFVLH